tara:strand:+ start:6040 stop:6858 length:819 start_codon:yes stop_codon:yes gene_type:complete
MPNHCFCNIQVYDKKDIKLLKQIEQIDTGLAGFIKPMPECLNNTTMPVNIISQKEYDEQELKRKNNPEERIFSSGITKEMQTEYKDKFKFDNWYNWASFNWGTKWGCYENEVNLDSYTFTTAWSPLDDDILEAFAKLTTKGFFYTFEEETGWGGVREYDENGVCKSYFNYEEPNWEEMRQFWINKEGVIKEVPYEEHLEEPAEDFEYLCEVSELKEDHDNGSDQYSVGFYECYNLQEYYGKTLADVFNEVCKDKNIDSWVFHSLQQSISSLI